MKMSRTFQIGILTISDRCFVEDANDKSGSTIESIIKCGNFIDDVEIAFKECVPDEVSLIRDKLIKWCDENHLDLILTTGGTGIAPRDVTPEATKSIIEKELSGVATAILLESLKVTPMAMLSRLICGTRNETLIVNFPGSVNACSTSLDVIRPVIKHAMHLLKNQTKNVDNIHMQLHLRSKVKTESVAKRDRKSSYQPISTEDAQNIILNVVKPLTIQMIDCFACDAVAKRQIEECADSTTQVSLCKLLGFSLGKENRNALGYSLFADILAPENLPPYPTSVKDGYAVISSDGAGLRTVVGAVVAGDTVGFKLEKGCCVRITTGAPIPELVDAVVQVEDTKLVKSSEDGREELEIEILKEPFAGQDIRSIGSDIKMNSLLVKARRALSPFDLALLASAGITHVTVVRKPTIAVLSTGNELQNPEKKLLPGHIRDSNKIMLAKLLEKEGFSIIDCGIASDEPNDILFKVNNALSVSDILISTGGVSMGEKDLLAQVLSQDLNAKLHFGRINMKPGKPTKFFSVPKKKETKFVFALPGNPVSAAATFYLFVLPALRRMSNIEPALPRLIKVKIDKEIRLDERSEFARASLQWDENGVAHAELTGSQSSSRLLSMVNSECLLHLPASKKSKEILSAGSIVNAQFI